MCAKWKGKEYENKKWDVWRCNYFLSFLCVYENTVKNTFEVYGIQVLFMGFYGVEPDPREGELGWLPDCNHDEYGIE